MQKFLRAVFLGSLIAGFPALASAGDLKLTLANGRVTLIAQDVPLRQILDEWARVGKTTIVNGDKLTGPPMTFQLIDRPEREVLDLLLRSASGYIVAQRAVSMAGASQFDRVMILPVSRGPVGAASAAPPPQFRQPQPQMPMPMPATDDDDPVEPPQIMPPGMGQQNVPSPVPFQVPPGQQPAMTAPRPGILPAPPAGQPNPYGPPGMPPGTPPPFGRPPGGPGGPGGA